MVPVLVGGVYPVRCVSGSVEEEVIPRDRGIGGIR